jgi:hypothetical protein
VWEIRPMLNQYGFVILMLIVIAGGPFLQPIFSTVTRVLVGL